MKMAQYSLEMVRGDTKYLTVDVSVSGEHQDLLTGDVVTMTVRKSGTDGIDDLIFSKEVSVFEDGKAIIHIEPADTAEMMDSTYSYDVQIVFANGDTYTPIWTSPFLLKGEVTLLG